MDLFRTTPGAPCTLTTIWFQSTVGGGAVASGVLSVALVGTISTIRRTTGKLPPLRNLWSLCSLLLGSVVFGASCVLLWADAGDAIADPRAAWRALFWLGTVMFLAIGVPQGCANVLRRTVLSVSGLDRARFHQLDRKAKCLTRGLALCASLVAVGSALALFGTTAGAQGAGAQLTVAGATLVLTCFVILVRFGQKTINRGGALRDGRGASVPAKHVASLLVLYRRSQRVALSLLAILGTAAVLRAPAGATVIWLVAAMQLAFAILVPLTAHKRLAPTRQRQRASRAAGALHLGKVHPATGCTGTIVTHAARTSGELVMDPVLRTAVQADDDRPWGLAHNGVSLALLKQFADEHSIEPGMTAADVCAQHVKPTTSKAALSLVAVLQGGHSTATGTPWVGAPTFFISYAWSFAFRMLIDIVEQHELAYPPAKGHTNYYFFDQFSLNQHKFVDGTPRSNPHSEQVPLVAVGKSKKEAAKEMQRQVVGALKAQMLKAGHVLMCLWPLEMPVPLSRAWCLFELWVALENDIGLTMCFGDADATALHEAVQCGSFDVAKVVGEIRAQDAGCTVQADKELILGLIEDEMGVMNFNAQMQERLLECMKQTAALTWWKKGLKTYA
jgi:hypothetical protein